LITTTAVNAVTGIGCVLGASCDVRRYRGVNGAAERFGKVELRSHQRLISKVDFEMNVRSAALIPAGIDGLKLDNPIRIAGLNAAQEGLTRSALLGISGVDACGIAVSDLGERIWNGKTRAGAHHSQQEA